MPAVAPAFPSQLLVLHMLAPVVGLKFIILVYHTMQGSIPSLTTLAHIGRVVIHTNNFLEPL